MAPRSEPDIKTPELRRTNERFYGHRSRPTGAVGGICSTDPGLYHVDNYPRDLGRFVRVARRDGGLVRIRRRGSTSKANAPAAFASSPAGVLTLAPSTPETRRLTNGRQLFNHLATEAFRRVAGASTRHLTLKSARAQSPSRRSIHARQASV